MGETNCCFNFIILSCNIQLRVFISERKLRAVHAENENLKVLEDLYRNNWNNLKDSIKMYVSSKPSFPLSACGNADEYKEKIEKLEASVSAVTKVRKR